MSFLILDNVGYEAESKRLFAAMSSSPDSSRKKAINNLIKQLKSNVIWNSLDVLWVMAAHDQQAARLNWKSPSSSFTLTEVNSPTWTKDQGYTGNGSNMSLNTNWNVASDSMNYTQNNSCHGAYLRINQISGFTISGWAKTGGGASRAQIIPRFTGDVSLLTINENNVNGINAANTNSSGFFTIERTGVSSTVGYRNGTSFGTASNTSVTIPSLVDMILCRNLDGVANSFDTNQISVRFHGASLGAARQMSFFNAVEEYMKTIGSGVA